MFDPLSGRRFLQASAVAGAFGFWPGPPRADDKKKQSANDKLHVGVIGIAGQGAYDLNEVHKSGGAGNGAFWDFIEGPSGDGIARKLRILGSAPQGGQTRERSSRATV